MGLRVTFSPGEILGLDLSAADGLYALALGVLLVSLGTVAAIRASRFGRALVAIREDEVLASFLGIAVTGCKVAAFATSAVLAALAGAVYGPFMSFISPDLLSGSEAISLVGVLIVGGLGTMLGPILGTLIFFGLPELLQVARLYRLVILGCVIVGVVILMPEGIAGLAARKLGRPARPRARLGAAPGRFGPEVAAAAQPAATGP